MPQLEVRRAWIADETEILRAHRETVSEVPNFLHYFQEGMAFNRYLDVLDERERGVDLPQHHVPSTFLFGFSSGRVVGRVAIRHRLTDSLFRVGGHIGFVVVPAFRRQGHATSILGFSLLFARDTLNLDRVLVTCDDDNVGSIRTIEKNGGVLENVIDESDLRKPTRRYWIDTTACARG
jgi:predicted acetyltransferase